jgi:hypothetical protein
VNKNSQDEKRILVANKASSLKILIQRCLYMHRKKYTSFFSHTLLFKIYQKLSSSSDIDFQLNWFPSHCTNIHMSRSYWCKNYVPNECYIILKRNIFQEKISGIYLQEEILIICLNISQYTVEIALEVFFFWFDDEDIFKLVCVLIGGYDFSK